MKYRTFAFTWLLGLFVIIRPVLSQTVALWLFDEQIGLYPSCVLTDAGPEDIPLILGPGGQMAPGKFGNALEPSEQAHIDIPEGSVRFGLTPLPVPEGRTVEPMTWMNANFAALITHGETHLRKEVRFVKPTQTKLNLGRFDWTVEFWYLPIRRTGEEGVIFEIGQGPRGENETVTRLTVNADGSGFRLFNQPGGTDLHIPSKRSALDPGMKKWHHHALVYDSGQEQLNQYVDGKRQKPAEKCR